MPPYLQLGLSKDLSLSIITCFKYFPIGKLYAIGEMFQSICNGKVYREYNKCHHILNLNFDLSRTWFGYVSYYYFGNKIEV